MHSSRSSRLRRAAQKVVGLTLAVMLAFSATFTVQPPPQAHAFVFLILRELAKDIAKEIAANKFKQAITYIYQTGIVDGYADGTFKPDATINRAELVKILVNALKLPTDSASTTCFADFKGDEWYAKFACVAKEKGIISGYPDGSFGGGNVVNKAEALKIVLNALGINPNASGASLYTDVAASDWFAGYAGAARDGNLIDGADASKFNPSQPLTRGSVADLVFRTVGVNQTKTLYDQYFDDWKNKKWDDAYSLISNADKTNLDLADFKFVNENAEMQIEKLAWRGGFTLNTGATPTITGDYSLTYTLPNDLGGELFSYPNTATGVFEDGVWKIKYVGPTKAVKLSKTVSSSNGVNSLTFTKLVSGPQQTILIGTTASTDNCTLVFDIADPPKLSVSSGDFSLSYKRMLVGNKVYWVGDKDKNGYLDFKDASVDIGSGNGQILRSEGSGKCSFSYTANDNPYIFSDSSLKNIPLDVNGR